MAYFCASSPIVSDIAFRYRKDPNTIMKKKTGKIFANIIIILLLIVLYFIIRTKIGITVNDSQISLKDNWQITVNNVPHEETVLKDVFFPVTNIGDHVELKTILPDISTTSSVLQFKIYHSIITVYLDDQKIYDYGSSLNAAGEMVGSGFHWVALPEDYVGKTLKICFDVTEDNAFSSIDAICILAENNTTRNFILTNITEIIIGIFLLSFGILLSILMLFFGKAGKEYWVLFWIAIFSIAVAVWMLSNFCIWQLIFRNLHIIAYFEYLSLYFAPIPMLLFVCGMHENKRTKHAIYLFVTVLVLFNAIVIVLNELNIYHFSKALQIFHILGLCAIALTTISDIISMKQQNKKSNQMMLWGLGIMVVFLFADILRFNIDKYIHPKNVDLSNSFLSIGVLTFVITMIASYVYKMLLIYYESAEKQALIQIAYTDALTHVGNRAMCEKEFHARDSVKNQTTVINFDLNHFKEVNDTFGHSVGDQLLVEFAGILQDNYKEDGFIGRMGGDEFIVILNNNDISYVDKTLVQLMIKIDKLNHKENRPYQISVAYGYCSNRENPDYSLWDMYQKSDAEMYQHKTSHR